MSIVNFGSNYTFKDLPNFKEMREADTLWRFLSLEKFLMMLTSRSIWFARYDTFEDKFEGDVPKHWKNKKLAVHSTNFQLAYISSWYRGEFEPISMWMAYGEGKNTAICIKSNAGTLKNTLKNSSTPNDLPFNIDPVNYFNFDDKSISKPSDLTLTGREEQGGCYLGKRINFEHENEIRAYFIDPLHNQYNDADGIPRTNNIQEILEGKEPGHDVKVDLNELISEIIISPYAGPNLKKSLEILLDRFKINAQISKSTILDANQ